RRCRKRNYAMSIKGLFDAVERRGDIGRRVAALILPISNRPRVTSSCEGKLGSRDRRVGNSSSLVGRTPATDPGIPCLPTPAAHARGGRRRSWNQARYLLIFSRCAAGA